MLGRGNLLQVDDRVKEELALIEVLPESEGLAIRIYRDASREVRQGLGWRLPQPQWSGSPRAFTHGGISGGRLWVEPEAGFAVAFLTNRWQAPIEVSLSVIDEVYRAWDRA